MLIKANESCLLIVDVQDKMVTAMHDYPLLLAHCKWLIGVADYLQVPVIFSEQYPKGSGHTVASLKEQAKHPFILTKTHFSCAADDNCYCYWQQVSHQQVVIAGIESHVCVLQTAIQLQQSGKQVFVVADAISARDSKNTELAIDRLRQLGIQIVSKEMVLFEWAHRSGTAEFKYLSEHFLKQA